MAPSNSKMLYKKGQGLSIETTIMVLLALLGLIIVILVFTGQSGDFFDSVKEFISGVNTPQVDYQEVVG